MGYTHYFTPTTKTATKRTTGRLKKLLRHGVDAGILDCDEDSDQCAMTSTDVAGRITRVWFNGIGDNAHETFMWERGGEWAFCKTAYKPYDGYVVAVLMVLLEAGCISDLSSDGDLHGEDGDHARSLLLAVGGKA